MKIFGLEIRKVENTTYVLSSGKIRIGDVVLADEKDYPHWKNHPQIVTCLFGNGDLGVDDCIRVNRKSYKKILFVF
jgi:hypothetical protein